MVKLNNRGFAITGILYTVFIVFSLILVSVLGGLQAKKNILEKSLFGLENQFQGSNSNRDSLIASFNSTKKAPVTGKYVFQFSGGEKSFVCSSYLNKDTSINHTILFVPDNCNDYSYRFSFESDNSSLNVMEIIDIYNFEEE